jgi:hypothetical protein
MGKTRTAPPTPKQQGEAGQDTTEHGKRLASSVVVVDDHTPRLRALAHQLRSVAGMVERGELGNVEDMALLLTAYKQAPWCYATRVEARDLVVRSFAPRSLDLGGATTPTTDG